MTFDAWLDQLRADGYLLCPSSTAVPVELRAVRPDGWGVHLRCRGVRVRLGLYRPGRAAWEVPMWDPTAAPEETLELWQHLPLALAGPVLATGTRIAFTGDHERPDHEAIYDGAREHGWRGYDAALLPPAAAARIFTQLLAATESAIIRDHQPAAAAGAAAPNWQRGESLAATPAVVAPALPIQPTPSAALARQPVLRGQR